MDWEKSGPVCTQEQAEKLTDRMLANFTWPQDRLGALLDIWLEGLQQWPYTYAARAVQYVINTQTDKRLPPFAVVRELMNEYGLRDQNEGGA